MPSRGSASDRLAPVALGLAALLLAAAFAYGTRGRHGMALPFLGAAVAGAAASTLRQPIVPLGLGVALGAVGSVFGFSMGYYGVGTGWLLALAGALAHPDRVVGGTGIAASLAPFAVMMAAVAAGSAWLMHLWPVVLGPAVAWAVLAVVRARGRKD